MKNWMSTSLAVSASLEPGEDPSLAAQRLCQLHKHAHRRGAGEGETEQRIYLLSAWQAPCHTDRERAALAWTDALTQPSQGHTHEAAYEVLKAQFSEEEQVKLTLVINVINGWNRLAVGFDAWLEQAATKTAA
jgi:alkylhydroperoxidase family enzyme